MFRNRLNRLALWMPRMCAVIKKLLCHLCIMFSFYCAVKTHKYKFSNRLLPTRFLRHYRQRATTLGLSKTSSAQPWALLTTFWKEAEQLLQVMGCRVTLLLLVFNMSHMLSVEWKSCLEADQSTCFTQVCSRKTVHRPCSTSVVTHWHSHWVQFA